MLKGKVFGISLPSYFSAVRSGDQCPDIALNIPCVFAYQNAKHNWEGFAKLGRQKKRKELSFVADFSKRDDTGRYEKCFHLGDESQGPDVNR
jgi:hypothetical protein